jgi:hypothetical protein
MTPVERARPAVAGVWGRVRAEVRGRPVMLTVGVVAAALMVLAALDGCASPGGGATAHNDIARCAAVLPLARDVVHGQGTLTLVRPVDRGDLDALTQQAGAVSSPPSLEPGAPGGANGVGSGAPNGAVPGGAVPGGAPPNRAAPVHPAGPSAERPPKPTDAQTGQSLPKACLVVYRGNYPAGSIPHSQPSGASGEFALVIVKVRHPAVYRVLITDTLPPSAKRSWWHF